VRFESLERGRIATVGTNTTLRVNRWHDAVNELGQPYAIVHQYQHHDLLHSEVLRAYPNITRDGDGAVADNEAAGAVAAPGAGAGAGAGGSRGGVRLSYKKNPATGQRAVHAFAADPLRFALEHCRGDEFVPAKTPEDVAAAEEGGGEGAWTPDVAARAHVARRRRALEEAAEAAGVCDGGGGAAVLPAIDAGGCAPLCAVLRMQKREGQGFGLGMVQSEDGHISVSAVGAGGSAEAAGVVVGARLLAVAGRAVRAGLALDAVAAALRAAKAAVEVVMLAPAVDGEGGALPDCDVGFEDGDGAIAIICK
jgi:hypothetical protein